MTKRIESKYKIDRRLGVNYGGVQKPPEHFVPMAQVNMGNGDRSLQTMGCSLRQSKS